MSEHASIRKRFKISKNRREITMFFVMLGMFAVGFVISPAFRSVNNVLNILNQNAIYGIMALGMGCVILTGAIDLSAGSIVALVGVIATPLFRDYGFVAGLFGGLATGAGLGLINGLIITKGKIGYFVTTLGMMSIARGAVYIITGGVPIQGVPSEFNVIGMGKIGVVPVAALIWLIALIVMYSVLKYTRLGQYLYAIGGSENASWLSGIDTDKMKIIAFTLEGFLCAIAGLILNTRVLMATADAADGYEMTVIASCIIGGMAIDGGKGNIVGSAVGAIIMGLILNILQLMGVSSYWQKAVTGLIIIVAVGIDRFSNTRKE